MKLAVISANLGNFDPLSPHVPQILSADDTCECITLTDQNFPPRFSAMRPRLQARIPKCFAWQIFPDFDYYVWIDASCRLSREDSVVWFLKQCKENYCDIAVFLHPDRHTIAEEYSFLKQKLSEKNKYLCSRYEGEFLEEQYSVISNTPYLDNKLYASTAFIYRNNKMVREMLKEWWYHISRYHIIDQLAFPFVLEMSNCMVYEIQDNYLKCPYIEYTRNKDKKA